MCVRLPGGGFNLGIGHIFPPVANVLSYGRIEQHRFLAYHTDLVSEPTN
jgi:hypothetical protein